MSVSTNEVIDTMMAEMMDGIDRLFEEASNSKTVPDGIIGDERDGKTKEEVSSILLDGPGSSLATVAREYFHGYQCIFIYC